MKKKVFKIKYKNYLLFASGWLIFVIPVAFSTRESGRGIQLKPVLSLSFPRKRESRLGPQEDEFNKLIIEISSCH